MKKKKLLRNVSLVALSAVMMSGVALTATACGGGGGGSPTTMTVNIFCNKVSLSSLLPALCRSVQPPSTKI